LNRQDTKFKKDINNNEIKNKNKNQENISNKNIENLKQS